MKLVKYGIQNRRIPKHLAPQNMGDMGFTVFCCLMKKKQ